MLHAGMNVAMFHRDTLELFYARTKSTWRLPLIRVLAYSFCLSGFFDTHGNDAENSAGNGDALAKLILDAPPGTVIGKELYGNTPSRCSLLNLALDSHCCYGSSRGYR